MMRTVSTHTYFYNPIYKPLKEVKVKGLRNVKGDIPKFFSYFRKITFIIYLREMNADMSLSDAKGIAEHFMALYPKSFDEFVVN